MFNAIKMSLQNHILLFTSFGVRSLSSTFAIFFGMQTASQPVSLCLPGSRLHTDSQYIFEECVTYVTQLLMFITSTRIENIDTKRLCLMMVITKAVTSFIVLTHRRNDEYLWRLISLVIIGKF